MPRTLPFARFLRANWAPLRDEAIERGFVRSYRVVARPPDVEGWDVLLATEYVDSTAFARREALFRPLMERREMVRIDGLGPRDFAEAVDTTLHARSVLASP